MKKSFILHLDSLCVLDDLTNEQRGELFYAMYCYQTNQEIILNPITKIAFSQFKNQFVRDGITYENTVKARQQAGSKGGKQRVTNQANATKIEQKVANQAVSVNDSVSVSVNDSVSDNKKEKNIKPFSFSLNTTKQLSNTNQEYKSKLEEYIKSSNKSMKYQEFYDSCEMKGYKYKNFKLVYDKWNNKATAIIPANNHNKNNKTFDEVLEMYMYEIKQGTQEDYAMAKCKEFLHWNLHKNFEKAIESAENERIRLRCGD